MWRVWKGMGIKFVVTCLQLEVHVLAYRGAEAGLMNYNHSSLAFKLRPLLRYEKHYLILM